MPTPKLSPYRRHANRYAKAMARLLCEPEDERQLELVNELHHRELHWQSHETDLDGCPYCRRYPPLSN